MINNVTVKFQKVRSTSRLPVYATPGAACCDVYADTLLPFSLCPGENPMVIPTGLIAEIPQGYEIQVRSRSGLAVKGVCVANGIGTIDSDYRKEIGVILTNLGENAIVINPGDRIAQLAITPVYQMIFKEVQSIENNTERTGGFGSTGK